MNGRHIVTSGGIAYGKQSQAVFVPASTPDDIASTIISPTNAWASWGATNLQPVLYAADIENVPSLTGPIETKARMAIGRGFLPFVITNVQADGTEEVEFINDPDILAWLENNNDFLHGWQNVYNMLAYGWGATQIVMSKDGRLINRIKATDVYQARLKKLNSQKQIESLYLYGDWSKMVMPDALVTLPVLEEGNELDDLKARSGEAPEFVILHRMLKNGAIYYPKPLWMAAKAWVDIAKSIPALKNQLNVNQISIKYVITISPEYWKKFHEDWDSYTPDKKQEIMEDKYDEIDTYLVGTDKTGKSITAGAYVDPVTKTVIPDIKIDVIDDKMAEGKMLPDASAADKQIMMAQLFNPAINGANLLADGSSGGAGSGSDIREAAAVQLVLMHAERMLNLKIFNVVKHYNGWFDKYKSQGMLVFRYQNSILTTLDTGKSAQNLNL
jgi:hypothetical protein